MAYPRIHLAIDNCFASKRWTQPSEWIDVVHGLGLRNIEASTDTECDPLYTGPEYLRDWVEEVKSHSARRGVRVANLYSGHGTYSTLGLAHTDARVRDRFHHEWIEPLILTAESLGAGVGFFCHAFPDAVLQDRDEYALQVADLTHRFSDLAAFAARHGTTIGVEQMYTPHQVPWTIEGAASMIRAVHARHGSPFYITIDTGHATAQARFARPSDPDIQKLIDCPQESGLRRGGEVWLGSDRCRAVVEEARRSRGDKNELVRGIVREMDTCPHLFAQKRDSDPYAWLAILGCYSPIVHLQQTDGARSIHAPFTAPSNATGIISPERLLQAIATSYRPPVDSSMPPRCTDIYLTLEIFFHTDASTRDIVRDLRESVAHWRTLIPADGAPLDQITAAWAHGPASSAAAASPKA